MSLYIKQTKFGRGVFSTVPIKKGMLVEACPVLPLSKSEYEAVLPTKLHSYVYTWPGSKQKPNSNQDKWTGACVAFGFGSLYNHSDDPNSVWRADVKNQLLNFRALRDIEAHEEITHNYEWPDWMREEMGIQ